jgi:hypothetical protein
MTVANVLTNNGEEWVVDRLIATSGTYSSSTGAYVGWGTGAGTSNKTDTTLFTHSNDPVSTNLASTNATLSKTGTGSAAKWQCVSTLPSTTSQTITNAGIWSGSNASTATLFVKGDFTGIPLSNGDSIQFTFTLDPS